MCLSSRWQYFLAIFLVDPVFVEHSGPDARHVGGMWRKCLSRRLGGYILRCGGLYWTSAPRMVRPSDNDHLRDCLYFFLDFLLIFPFGLSRTSSEVSF